ncbi:MAG: hypothetical protein ACP5LS_05370, partial [Thermoprotei archaeon]
MVPPNFIPSSPAASGMVSGRVFPYLNGAIRFLQGREDQVGILSFSVELLNGLPFLPGLGGYLGGRP